VAGPQAAAAAGQGHQGQLTNADMTGVSVRMIFRTLLVAIAVASSASADEPGTGVVYGDNHVFMVTAPAGWLLDNTSGVSQGLHAVFYPKGSSWEKGTTVMYANVAVLDTFINKDFDAVLDYDTSNFRKKSPSIVIVEKDTIVTKSKTSARVFYFSNDRNGNYEAVCYIGEKTAVIMLVMSSKTKKEFDKYLPKYAELVKSYFWMTDKADFDKRHR
jgi:hypothetical protein